MRTSALSVRLRLRLPRFYSCVAVPPPAHLLYIYTNTSPTLPQGHAYPSGAQWDKYCAMVPYRIILPSSHTSSHLLIPLPL